MTDALLPAATIEDAAIEDVARRIIGEIPGDFPLPAIGAAIGCTAIVHAQGDLLPAMQILAAAMQFVASAECEEVPAPEARVQ